MSISHVSRSQLDRGCFCVLIWETVVRITGATANLTASKFHCTAKIYQQAACMLLLDTNVRSHSEFSTTEIRAHFLYTFNLPHSLYFLSKVVNVPNSFPPHKKHQSVKCVIDSNYFSVVRTAYKICYTMRQDCMKNVILLIISNP